jgi:hypothetical protein
MEMEVNFSSRVIAAEWFVRVASGARRGMERGACSRGLALHSTPQLRCRERHLQSRSASREHG